MKEIYTDFHFAGGTMSGDQFNCKIGAATFEGMSARPLKKSWTEIYALTAQAEALEKEGKTPSPEMVRQLVDFYVDLLTAFSTKPIQIDGFDCSGKDDKGKPVHIATGAFTAGGFEPGIYPEFSVDGLDLTVEDDGYVRLGNFTWKRMDVNGAIEALKAATTLDDAWFAANWRKLIPIFDGFSAADLAIDVPDEEKEGERVQATAASLDATFGQYVNGTPADISLSLEGLVVPITAAMTESRRPSSSLGASPRSPSASVPSCTGTSRPRPSSSITCSSTPATSARFRSPARSATPPRRSSTTTPTLRPWPPRCSRSRT